MFSPNPASIPGRSTWKEKMQMYSPISQHNAELTRSTIGRLLPLAFAATLAGSAVLASPITYTMTATASGTFAGTAFNNAAITVTSIADTTQVFQAGALDSLDPGYGGSSDYEVIALSSSIDIAGFAPATFTDETFWEDPNGSGDIIFGDVAAGSAATGDGILGFTRLFVGLESYDLKSSFGPVSSAFDFETSVFNHFQNVSTSEGSLSLVASNDTFNAVVSSVPEPAYPLVPALVLLGLLTISRARATVRNKKSAERVF
jgi:hypothetical protein